MRKLLESKKEFVKEEKKDVADQESKEQEIQNSIQSQRTKERQETEKQVFLDY